MYAKLDKVDKLGNLELTKSLHVFLEKMDLKSQSITNLAVLTSIQDSPSSLIPRELRVIAAGVRHSWSFHW